jgi:hypothetical protein
MYGTQCSPQLLSEEGRIYRFFHAWKKVFEKKCFLGKSFFGLKIFYYLKYFTIQSSRVLVPADTSKSTLRHHGIQTITRVMAYVADTVTLSSTMRTGGFELGSSALTSSTLKWLHRIQ